MAVANLSGLVISLGFMLYIAAMLVAPPLYQEKDIGNRLVIIEDSRARWNLSQLLFALGMGTPALGFLMLTLSQDSQPLSWMYYAGATAFAAGAVVGILLIVRQTQDPAAFWDSERVPLISGFGYLLLTLAGFLFFGLAMLQGDYPDWLGFLLVAASVILLSAIVLLRGSAAFFISIIVYLISFVTGIVIWRL